MIRRSSGTIYWKATTRGHLDVMVTSLRSALQTPRDISLHPSGHRGETKSCGQIRQGQSRLNLSATCTFSSIVMSGKGIALPPGRMLCGPASDASLHL